MQKNLYHKRNSGIGSISAKLKFHLKLWGLIFLVAYAIVGMWLFLEAFFRPDYKTTFWINKYSEANLEFVILAVAIPTIIYFLYHIIISMRKERKTITISSIE